MRRWKGMHAVAKGQMGKAQMGTAAVMLTRCPGALKLFVCSRQSDRRIVVGAAFLLTTLVIVVTPGPGVLYTVAAAISRGRRASLIAALGCTLGIIPHLVSAITGLAALLDASSLAFQALKYVGVAYLFDEPSAVLRMLGLGSVFMLVTLLVFAGYGVLAARVRSLVLDRPRTVAWMRRIFAGSYVVLAGRLAVSER
jgi:threonine/homoserine/homoserine lactone efflux protein